MDVKEIQALIDVRDYINIMINNYNREKSELVDLRAMIILIDNKIVGMLLGDEFKEYINFSDAKRAVAKAAEVNSALLKKPVR